MLAGASSTKADVEWRALSIRDVGGGPDRGDRLCLCRAPGGDTEVAPVGAPVALTANIQARHFIASWCGALFHQADVAHAADSSLMDKARDTEETRLS